MYSHKTRSFRPLVLLLLLALLAIATHARAADWPGSATQWHGFDRYDFQHDGVDCFVVVPNDPAPGNPWVWRAQFPTYHTETDLLLLQRGFHVAHLKLGNVFGSERALDHWDQFYEMLVDKGLSPRPALEGVSRGGLYVYGWAARHPDRVACIYAEVPVCDIKSWPIGVSDPSTPALLEEYGLTLEEAMAYRGNPVDRLEPLAQAGIPLLHLISRNDEIVPATENTDVLAERYRALGGEISVIEVAVGPRANGHHLDHPDPVLSADFIERHASAVPAEDDYFTLRGDLDNCRHTFEREGRGRVVFLGGSITYNPGWRDQTMAYLCEQFPETEFEFVNAGIPSMGSTPGAFRLVRDVLSGGHVDLLFVEAAVNDAANGSTPEEMTRAVEGIVRQVRRVGGTTDIVMMHFVDPRKIEDFRAGQTPEVIQRHEAVAEHYGVPSLNLALEVTERIDAGQFTWDEDFRNLHPSPFGQRLYSASIRRLLSTAWSQPLAEEAAPQEHELPEEVLDEYNYSGARLMPIAGVGQAQGFAVANRVDPRAGGVGGGVRAGFYNVPMLVGTAPGASFEYAFTGRAVGLFVAAGPDAGMIEYRIDNEGEWQTLDLFTNWSRGLHLPWAYVLNAELEAGEHVLAVRIAADRNESSKGHACRIAHFLVNE